MDRDRSLDEFFGSEGGDDDAGDSGESDASAKSAEGDADADAAGEATDSDPGGDEGDEGRTQDSAAVDPATVTYRWSPTETTCDRCGATVERRWRDDGAYVCADCKEW